jgi:hypothetical protein
MQKVKSHATRVAIVAGAAILGIVGPAGAQIVIERTQIAEPVGIPGLGMPGQMKTGTGRIAGRVLSADTGAPLRRAQVRIMAPEIGAKAALTNTDGRYEFKDLPAGRFTINASKSGYVSVQYGQTRPFESGRPIELADKQVLDKVDIALPRGGVISGRVLDEFGEPVADAMVSTMRQTWANGRRRLQPAGRTAQTNDLGQFRLYGLTPGEYYVSATLRNTEVMIFDMGLGGAAGGGGSGSQPTSGYAPTYFPGTSVVTNAQRIAVTVGQEAQNADIALVPVRLARISGTVMSSEGKPMEGAMVIATPLNRSGDIGLAMMAATGRASKDGHFTISGVAPGDYTLTVRSMRIIAAEGGDVMAFRANVAAGMDGDCETASLPVSVAGEDLANVLIVTAKGGTAEGRVTFEGAKPIVPTSIRLTAMAADVEGPMIGGSAAVVKPDGSFELKGLSGRRLIRAGNLPAGWTMKAIRMNGEDITDSGMEFKSGSEVSGVEVVLINKQTEISGVATEANGTPLKDYTVIVFSEDQQYWNLPFSRWVTGARPNQDGRFQVRNMPPGSYYAVAVDYVEQGGWGDPELLERLKLRARRFTLAEGATETLDLKLVEQY